MYKSNLSLPIYIAYKLAAMLLVSVELLWHETGRRGKKLPPRRDPSKKAYQAFF